MALNYFRVCTYINGVLFWPRNVSYAGGQGDVGEFAIELPAVPQWDILPPRSHAVVFFTDNVTGQWRMLCEGEFTSIARAKNASGQRSLSLQFRGLHGYWNSVPFVSLSSLVTTPPAGNGADDQVTRQILSAVANGMRLFPPPSSTNKLVKITDFNVLIDKVTDRGTRISSLLPNLIKNATLQSPVDSFYLQARKLVQKAFAFSDAEIGEVVDYQRLKDVIKNGFNNFGLTANTKLGQIIEQYENLSMYQHVPLCAPPVYGTSAAAREVFDRAQRKFATQDPFSAAVDTLSTVADHDLIDSSMVVPEVLFIPHLYPCVPPACNVIFKDQLAQYQMSRNYLSEPTRVITELQLPEFETSIPKYYMANDVLNANDVIKISNPTKVAPGLAVTHDILSQRELMQGVNSVYMPVGLEKLQNTHTEKGPGIDTYLNLATRHHFDVARGACRSVSLTCVFMPYIAVGFPCLVEDATGPYFGIVARIQHSMPATGAPSTSLVITHVREAYQTDQQIRNAPPPKWLNSRFLPSKIDETYQKMFGANAFRTDGVQHAAMLPAQRIAAAVAEQQVSQTVNDYYASEQVNLDELARLVVPTPLYTKDLTLLDDGSGAPTIADTLRSTPDPVASMQQYQFRPGMSLSQYVLFHHLPIGVTGDIDTMTVEPPTDLAPTAGAEGGHPLYGSPFGLKLIGEEVATTTPAASIYGVYELLPATAQTRVGGGTLISDLRQRASRTIKAKIDLGITKDT